MIKSAEGAVLARVSRTPKAPSAVVLVMHGGSADSFTASRRRDLAVLRLWPVARVIARSVPGAAVHRLRFSIRGWNGDGASALQDARWALSQLRRQYAGLPIVLVGHSMGARVALYAGGDDGVAGVVLLAPWAPSGDPAEQLAGRPVFIVQAGRDRSIPEATTRPWLALAQASRARLTRTVLPWAGHTMMRGFWVWHRLAARGVQTVLDESSASPGSDVGQPVSRSSDLPPRQPSL